MKSLKLAMAEANSSQITDADFDRLREAKPFEGKALVYSTPDSSFGFFILISEEDKNRESDFEGYSPAMQRVVEWANQRGASYLFLSPDCEEADFEASPDKASNYYDEVMEVVR